MMADFIIAADTAKFGQPEIKLGVTPGMGGSQRLTCAVGKAKAMEMCLTGRMMGAEEAERSGLVAKVVPAADLLDEALKTAETIAAMAPLAAIATKEMVNAAFEMGLAQGINFERRLFHGLFGTEDQKEGMTAFVEKRPGKWTGWQRRQRRHVGSRLTARRTRSRHGTRRIHRAGAYGRRAWRPTSPRRGMRSAPSTSARKRWTVPSSVAASAPSPPPTPARMPTRSSPCCRPASMSPRSIAIACSAPRRKSAILMDCSTIDVATAKTVEDEAQRPGLHHGRRAGVGRHRRGRGGHA